LLEVPAQVQILALPDQALAPCAASLAKDGLTLSHRVAHFRVSFRWAAV
jgi:hypothetical protein